MISSFIYQQQNMVCTELAEIFKDRWCIFAFFEFGLGRGRSIGEVIVK